MGTFFYTEERQTYENILYILQRNIPFYIAFKNLIKKEKLETGITRKEKFRKENF